MKLRRTATVLATTSFVAGIASTAPASAHIRNDVTESHIVVTGRMHDVTADHNVTGNRHQVHLKTVGGKVSGKVRSYYCPTGASISPTWASSKCTLRNTYALKNVSSNGKTALVGRISSTEQSARQFGFVAGGTTSGKRAVFSLDLRLTKAIKGGDYVGAYVYGGFGYAPVDTSVTHEGLFYKSR